MRILIAHNNYKTPSGEDAVVEAEFSLLKDFGHEVLLYRRSNEELDSKSVVKKLQYLRQLGWSAQTYRDIKTTIKKFRPDVAHFHNIFYVITPAAYFACKEEGIPVVQSQHNFRLICSNGLLYRQNKVCEDCLNKSLWEGVYHGCYKNSRLLTTLIALSLMGHWRKGTWQNMVNVFITASQLGRQKLIAAGIAPGKILVKPNFVYPDPGQRRNDFQNEKYALYVGRLASEKGVEIMLKAWQSITDFPLRIIGSGPLLESLKVYARQRNMHHVEFLGYVDPQKYDQNMRGASFLVVPSLTYENFPRVVAEAFAYAVPVLASRLGSLQEIVGENENGILFEGGNPSDLAKKAKTMIAQQTLCQRLGKQARQTFEQKYSVKQNYEDLMHIYQKSMEAAAYE